MSTMQPITQQPYERLTPEAQQTYPCTNYCCSAFTLYAESEFLIEDELDNPIHPIFAPERFSDELDYAILEPCLRLATLILESDAAVPFLNIYFDGQILNSWNKTVSKISEVEYYDADGNLMTDIYLRRVPKPGQDQVTDETRSRARSILESMAEMVDYHLMPVEEQANENTGAWTMFCASVLPSHTDEAFQGCRSRIEFSRSTYDELVGLTNELFYMDKSDELYPSIHFQLAKYRFMIARIFIHELGHAFGKASHGLRPREVVYRNKRMSEAGYSLEAVIFGGIIQGGDYSRAAVSEWDHACEKAKVRWYQNPLVVEPWPSAYRCRLHEILDAEYLTIGKVSVDVIERVPYLFIESLFTKAFWQQALEGGTRALHPPKKGRWPFYMKKDEDIAKGITKGKSKKHVKASSTNNDKTSSEENDIFSVECLPFTFEEAVNRFGPRRAASLCTCPDDTKEHRPEESWELDAADVLATSNLPWIVHSPRKQLSDLST